MAHQSSKLRASITSFSTDAPPQVEDLRELDTNPSDLQPPGVDEEREPQSLEEALTG